MKIVLTTILFLLTTIVNAETWVCAFKCYTKDDICQTKFEKKGKNFEDEWGMKFDIYKESSEFLSIVRLSASDEYNEAFVFSHLINKKTGDYKKQQLTNEKGFIEPRSGKCEVVK